jgi:hypothetical protein
MPVHDVHYFPHKRASFVKQENPAGRRGFKFVDQQSRSNRTAASVGPNESDRADSTDGLNNHGRRRYHDRARRHHHAPVGSALAIGITVKAGAATAFGVGTAETCNRAGK